MCLQSSEVPGSTSCEVEGLKCNMPFLKEQHMQVSALITDRHHRVKTDVRTNTHNLFNLSIFYNEAVVSLFRLPGGCGRKEQRISLTSGTVATEATAYSISLVYLINWELGI